MWLIRIALGCLLLAAASVPLSPGSQELRRWYGEPILERFTARPSINVDHGCCIGVETEGKG